MSTNLAINDSLHIFGDEKVLTISELSGAIKGLVEKEFHAVRIQGEVSGLKKHTSGHTYLSLKDNDSLINAICWKWTKIGFDLEDGMDIVVRGKVTTYPARSQYQFIIEEAMIAGEGALLKLLNERRKHFAALGYFEKKRNIPKFPGIIGIVTSKTGAVLQDMRHRLEDRFPFCHVIVWPVNVQGGLAAEQVANAVRGFNFMIDKKPDVLIVARGGGSIEDLWPFNEEIVVKAVFDSKIPVISAIGHETDTTLIDYAADLRAPTPTAAIELATPVLSEIKLQISEFSIRSENAVRRIVRELITIVSSFSKSLASSQFAILAISQKFDDKVDRFAIAIQNYFQREKLKLQTKKLISLENYLSLKRQSFNSKAMVFDKLSKNYLDRYVEKVKTLSDRLGQSSYQQILNKGFCFITEEAGKIIDTKAQFDESRSQNMSVHFKDGTSEL